MAKNSFAFTEDLKTGALKIFLASGLLTVTRDMEAYKEVKAIIDRIVDNDITDQAELDTLAKRIVELTTHKEEIESFVAKNGDRMEVRKNTVYFIRSSDGEEYELANSLQTRLKKILEEKASPGLILKFVSNLLQNPSARAVRELHRFLEVNDLPMTPDGCFLAYKKVQFDYLDFHSKTFDNSVGKEVSMVRNKVDDNPDQTCSAGLHVCSESYLPHYGSNSPAINRIVVCKVNPADVVSIPRDYNNAKLRCCKYYVVDELPTFETTLSKYVYGRHRDGFIVDTFYRLVKFYRDFFHITDNKVDVTGQAAMTSYMSDITPAMEAKFIREFASTFGISEALVQESYNSFLYNLPGALAFLSKHDEDALVGAETDSDSESPSE